MDGDQQAADALCRVVFPSLGGEAVDVRRLDKIEAPHRMKVVPQAVPASQLGEEMSSRPADTYVHNGHNSARSSALAQACDAGDDLFENEEEEQGSRKRL